MKSNAQAVFKFHRVDPRLRVLKATAALAAERSNKFHRVDPRLRVLKDV